MYLLSQQYVDLSTDALTAISESLGGGPVTIIRDAHSTKPADRGKLRKALVEHAQKDLMIMGLMAIERLSPSGRAPRSSAPSDAEKTFATLLGVDIVMLGGEDACSDMKDVAQIQRAARDLRNLVRA